MLILLTEYRHALYDMATEPAGRTEPGTPGKGTYVLPQDPTSAAGGKSKEGVLHRGIE